MNEADVIASYPQFGLETIFFLILFIVAAYAAYSDGGDMYVHKTPTEKQKKLNLLGIITIVIIIPAIIIIFFI
jgi:hypothetical protein